MYLNFSRIRQQWFSHCRQPPLPQPPPFVEAPSPWTQGSPAPASARAAFKPALCSAIHCQAAISTTLPWKWTVSTTTPPVTSVTRSTTQGCSPLAAAPGVAIKMIAATWAQLARRCATSVLRHRCTWLGLWTTALRCRRCLHWCKPPYWAANRHTEVARLVFLSVNEFNVALPLAQCRVSTVPPHSAKRSPASPRLSPS